jgi:hypothetical protein
MSRVDAALDSILPLLSDEGADADLEARVGRILRPLSPLERQRLMLKYVQAIYEMRGEARAELEACAGSVH